MLQSHIIEVDGIFIGVAVRLDIGFRFLATDIRVEELGGTVWPSLAEVQRVTASLYRSGRFIAPPRSLPAAIARVR